MFLLTLDLATTIGFSFGRVDDSNFSYGVFRLPSTGDDIGAYAAAYDAWLAQRLDIMSPGDLVVFEQPILPRQARLTTVRKLHGLTWHTEWACAQHATECREANVSKIKKFMTGRGNATKPDMITAARNLGYDPQDDNAADAIAIRLFTLAHRFPEVELSSAA